MSNDKNPITIIQKKQPAIRLACFFNSISCFNYLFILFSSPFTSTSSALGALGIIGTAPLSAAFSTASPPPQIALPNSANWFLQFKPLNVHIDPLKIPAFLQDLKTTMWTLNPKFEGTTRKLRENRAIGARSNLIPLSIWQALACKELTSTVAIVVRLTDRPLQRLLAWVVRISCQRHGSILRPWRTGGQRETRHHPPCRRRAAAGEEEEQWGAEKERGSNGTSTGVGLARAPILQRSPG
jgi:hypothetical protein